MPKITLTHQQLTLVQQAIEQYVKIGMGQLESLKEHPTLKEITQADTIINPLKRELHIQPNYQWSINNNQVTNEIKQLFDIHQQITQYKWQKEMQQQQIEPQIIIHLQDKKNQIQIE